MPYELSGKLLELFPTQEVSSSFKKREFVVEKSETASDRVFTDTIKFQLIQDRVALLDTYKVGDEVKVTFNIKGSKWEKEGRTSYFVNLDVWKMEKLSESSAIPTPAVDQPVVESTPLPEGEDDLPF